jgi:TonB-dependent receptor
MIQNRYALVLGLLTIVTGQRVLAQTTPPPSAPPDAPPAPAPGAPPATDGTEDDEADADEVNPADTVEPETPAPAAPSAPAAGDDAEQQDEAGADDAMDEEGDEDAGAESPGRPPPKGKGVVWGYVKDTEGELIEAPVQVVGTKTTVVTDENGAYRLELPPGTYNLRISYELHKSVRFDKVVVEAGKVQRLDTQLLSDEEAVDVVEVVEDADKSTVEGTTLARQRATAVGDSVGRAEIARTPAANAAQAAQRVPGATIVGNRFVYVRGLGERYTNALLNGAPLPSPEPDRAAIPLDVFPSLIVDSLSIVKTFTPDVPGDFAGGSVRIQTRELPTKPLLQGSLGFGFNDHATFRQRLAQRGSSTDYLGFDDGTRDLPELLKQKPYVALTPAELKDATQGINSYMSAVRTFTPPNGSGSIVAGNGWSLGNDQRIGALVALNYSRSFTYRDDGIARTFSRGGPTGIETETDYKLAVGNDKVSWGSLGSVSYWPSANHRLTLLGLHTQLADSSAQVVQGFNRGRSADIANTRLRYVSRALNFGQLRGEHDFHSLYNARLEWNGSLAHAGRSEPDTRDSVFQNEAGVGYSAITTPENGAHLNARQGESSIGGGLDWTQPLSDAAEATRLKVGGALSSKSRNFRQRRFHLETIDTANAGGFFCGTTYNRGCPDRFFTPANIASDALLLIEDTTPEDAYRAKLAVYATYGMVDLGITKDLRVVGGVRAEITRQELDPYPQAPGALDKPAQPLRSTDFLPAASVGWQTTKATKLRVSFSQTLARPQIRELAPFSYAPYYGARPFAGTPELKITHISNYDTRFEFYPTLREVLAFSFFAKTFRDPIENIVLASGSGVVKPQNSKGARLVGVEFEARKTLEMLSSSLKDLTLIANLTLARSKIELEKTNLTAVTNLERPMVNQAPYVLNLAMDYENEPLGITARALYNVSGKKIVEVGSGVPDAYEQPKHQVDLTVSKAVGKQLSFRFNAVNVLASDTVVTLGPKKRDDRIMRVHSVPQAFENVFSDDARIFTLSGTYTY